MDEIDTDRIDDAVLALMYLTLHDTEEQFGTARAWKSFDWDALVACMRGTTSWIPWARPSLSS